MAKDGPGASHTTAMIYGRDGTHAPTIELAGNIAKPRQLPEDGAKLRQDQNGSLEYAQNVLKGLKSLGVETTPDFGQLVTDRYGEVAMLRSYQYCVGVLGYDLAGENSHLALPGIQQVDSWYQRDDNIWGSDLAGVGHQFDIVTNGDGDDKRQKGLGIREGY
jgi:hypothetical protein